MSKRQDEILTKEARKIPNNPMKRCSTSFLIMQIKMDSHLYNILKRWAMDQWLPGAQGQEDLTE